MLSLVLDQELSSSAPDAARWCWRWWTETKPKDALKNFGVFWPHKQFGDGITCFQLLRGFAKKTSIFFRALFHTTWAHLWINAMSQRQCRSIVASLWTYAKLEWTMWTQKIQLIAYESLEMIWFVYVILTMLSYTKLTNKIQHAKIVREVFSACCSVCWTFLAAPVMSHCRQVQKTACRNIFPSNYCINMYARSRWF